MKQVELTFHTNYNGWSASVNGEYIDNTLLTDALVDVTVNSTDDDGDYFYSTIQSNHKSEVEAIVTSLLGNDINIKIEMDEWST